MWLVQTFQEVGAWAMSGRRAERAEWVRIEGILGRWENWRKDPGSHTLVGPKDMAWMRTSKKWDEVNGRMGWKSVGVGTWGTSSDNAVGGGVVSFEWVSQNEGKFIALDQMWQGRQLKRLYNCGKIYLTIFHLRDFLVHISVTLAIFTLCHHHRHLPPELSTSSRPETL